MNGNAGLAGDAPAVTYRSFSVAALALGLAAWPIGFQVGAYGVVFYENLFLIAVATTITFIVSFFAPRRTAGWITRTLLAAPATWLVLAVTLTDSVAAAATDPVLGTFGLLILVTSVPYAVYVLVVSFVPETRQVRDRRLLAGLVGMVVLVLVAGFLVGHFNPRFLTCQDFKVAGQEQPANCVHQ